MQINIKKAPGWDNFTNFLESMKSAIPAAASKLMYACADHAASRVRESILKQTGSWQPLSPWYKGWKIKHGLNPAILMSTTFYVNNIAAQKVDRWRWLAGVPNIPHPPIVGEPAPNLPELFQIHEFGYAHIPARPHFRPVWWDLASWVPRWIAGYGFVPRNM